MNEVPLLGVLVLSLQDWITLFLHYLSLSLLSIGGAITTAPDMHRFLVVQQHWLSDAQFTTSLAIAQSAPGPNVLFIALLGWNVGVNAGGPLTGLLGVFVTMLGILIPSTTLTYAAAQWGQRNRQLRAGAGFQSRHGTDGGGAAFGHQLDFGDQHWHCGKHPRQPLDGQRAVVGTDRRGGRGGVAQPLTFAVAASAGGRAGRVRADLTQYQAVVVVCLNAAGAAPRTGKRRWPPTRSGFRPRRASEC